MSRYDPSIRYSNPVPSSYTLFPETIHSPEFATDDTIAHSATRRKPAVRFSSTTQIRSIDPEYPSHDQTWTCKTTGGSSSTRSDRSRTRSTWWHNLSGSMRNVACSRSTRTAGTYREDLKDDARRARKIVELMRKTFENCSGKISASRGHTSTRDSGTPAEGTQRSRRMRLSKETKRSYKV